MTIFVHCIRYWLDELKPKRSGRCRCGLHSCIMFLKSIHASVTNTSMQSTNNDVPGTWGIHSSWLAHSIQYPSNRTITMENKTLPSTYPTIYVSVVLHVLCVEVVESTRCGSCTTKQAWYVINIKWILSWYGFSSNHNSNFLSKRWMNIFILILNRKLTPKTEATLPSQPSGQK